MHPKEVFSYCPKCSAQQIEYNINDNFLFCKKCDFQFFINRSAAVAGIITNDKNEILLTQRKIEPQKGMLDLPGGFVDLHETAEESIKREIKEELNVDVSSCKYFTSQNNEYTYNNITYFTLDLAYICTVDSFEKLKPQDDVSKIIFLPPHQIDMTKISFPSIKKILELYIKEL